MTDQRLCQKRGCPRAATQYVKICVPALGDPDGLPATDAMLALELCQHHIEAAEASVFVESAGDALRAIGEAHKRPGVACDWDSAYIVGVPIESGLGQQFSEITEERKPN